MIKSAWARYSLRDILIVGVPVAALVLIVLVLAIQHLDPAPPNHLTISTGADQSDLQEFALDYQQILKRDGVNLEIRTSNGPFENLRRLEDDASGVSVAFVQDGLGSTENQPDVVSLGSLYYEPIWVFYRSKTELNYFSQLEGKRIAVGKVGHGSQVIAQRLLKLAGVDATQTKLINMDSSESVRALERGEIDAALFMMSVKDPLIRELAGKAGVRMMNMGHAEAIARKDAAFHHLILPRGSIDLKADLPHEDVHLVSSTATLLVRDDLHPALAFLLLKAAMEVHSGPGVFEKRGEFPANKDDVFPLSDDAVQFYKSGGPFWQRYLPYWLAAWFDRFILLAIPILAVVVPLVRFVPQVYRWRLRSRIYQRYGELKYLETLVKPNSSQEQRADFLRQLDVIEDRVDKMRLPKNFSDYLYSLKGHIQFVRDRLEKGAKTR